jgi:hypothetical protein
MCAVIISADKGGVGKDTVTEGILLAAQTLNLSPAVVEIEIAPRLSTLYPHASFFRAGQTTPDELYRNPDLAFAAFDEAMPIARAATASAPAIVCLGAGFTKAFQIWSEASGTAFFSDEGQHLCFAVVLTMNRSALAAGLDNLYELGRLYPHARRVAILNEVSAEFIEGDRHLERRLKQASGDQGSAIETIRVRRMAAPTWGYLQNMGSLPQIAQKSLADLVALGLPEGPSARSLVMFEKWLANDLVAPLSQLLPQQERVA